MMGLSDKFLMTLMLSAASLWCAAAGPMSMAEARLWCDVTPLSAVEGIWEYPEDGATVLIRADKTAPGTYTLSILSTPDCRLERGDVIGRLHPTADPRQFRLEQMTKKDAHGLLKPADCTAALSTDGESLRVRGKKTKIRIQPYTLLPRFWRIVRISEKNPVEDLPAGLLKVYPGYDRNGSLKRNPRIL